MNAVVAAALETRKPMLAESFVRWTTRQFDSFVQQFGPTLKGVYNSRKSKSFREQVAPFITREQGEKPWEQGPVKLNTEKLAKAGAEYADAAVEAWIGKINEKLGELENAEVLGFDGAEFAIKGERAGHKIFIKQQQVMKVSSKGTWFHQWPARIYVDGEFTPEAAYKKMFA